ncbi:RNA-splicing ligase RtcB [Anaerobacterium chartisolvens]|uniref:3'-phosphate/5'-hydroxy nucleic acid ligase n=1 Tax=Anaerobacterium chartisolvens TaxID=1297424 RepID=A0A369AS59_9FIRM|nr:RtcB family protein [Anaerobacterium chartisolvens]RCX12071.1 RNA-splicing ligase RtcB [Anaerobacterium chartisolvens]
MIEIKGKYNTAKVFTDNVEEKAAEQILELCSQEFVQGSRIRIMPDTHAGAGCTIGTTMTIKDKIVPNLVGVDIGCGMFVSMLEKTKVDFDKLDKVIRSYVPSGFDVRETPHEYKELIDLDILKCKEHVDLKRASLSIGTLGGGNHFIEINEDENENIYLVVHSGSRYLGKQIAEYYQDRAAKEIIRKSNDSIIVELKSQGRAKEIQAEIEKGKTKMNSALAYVEGQTFDNYIFDMRIAQKFAEYNRMAIAEVIICEMGFNVADSFTTIHNYIDLDEMILRKGAISAKKGEVVIIPINMRDGSIIATGKGNADWNQSAPHGAGRLMSRKQAKRSLSLEEFKKSMDGIYTTSLSIDTLDEAPFAYKSMDEIIANIQDSVEISKIVRPIYNFKASDD